MGVDEVRIMIVDDDEVFLEELREVLSLSGYRVVSFNGGKEALAWARKNRPDVIMLDIKMQEMDGFKLTRNLKRFPETAGIPVIAMTGHYTKEEHAPLMAACGMETCLRKPFNAFDLMVQVNNVLGIMVRGSARAKQQMKRKARSG